MKHTRGLVLVGVMVASLLLTACSPHKAVEPTIARPPTVPARLPGPTTAPITPETILGTPEGGAINPGQFIRVTTVDSKSTCKETLDKDGFMSWEDLKVTTSCAVGLFTWPTSRQFDANWFFAQQKNGSQFDYQTGYEYTILSGANICAWYGLWLDARSSGDTNAEAASLQMIVYVIPDYAKTVRGFPSEVMDPSTTKSLADNALRAKLGDSSLIQQDYSANCATYTHWKTTS